VEAFRAPPPTRWSLPRRRRPPPLFPMPEFPLSPWRSLVIGSFLTVDRVSLILFSSHHYCCHHRRHSSHFLNSFLSLVTSRSQPSLFLSYLELDLSPIATIKARRADRGVSTRCLLDALQRWRMNSTTPYGVPTPYYSVYDLCSVIYMPSIKMRARFSCPSLGGADLSHVLSPLQALPFLARAVAFFFGLLTH